MYNIEKIDYTTFVSATMDLKKEGFYRDQDGRRNRSSLKPSGTGSVPGSPRIRSNLFREDKRKSGLSSGQRQKSDLSGFRQRMITIK